MGNKNSEYRVLEYACENVGWIRGLTDISAKGQEHPDFIMTDGEHRIGIEHFLVDTQLNVQEDSHSRHKLHDISKCFSQFKDGRYDNDPEGARQGLQNIVNEQLKVECDFDYHVFLKRFKKVFYEHLNKIDEYRKQRLDKVGFMIEIQVPQMEYMVTERNMKQHFQRMKQFPITTDMWSVMNQFEKIDFLVIAVIESIGNQHYVYMIEKKNKPKLYQEFALKHQGEPRHVNLKVEQ